MRKFYTLLFISFLFISTIQSQILKQNIPQPDAPVRASALLGDRLYIGGDFTFVGPHTPYGVGVDYYTSLPRRGFAVPNGRVNKVLPIPGGAWIIVGDFTQVGSFPRDGIARINADGSVHPLQVNVEKPNSQYVVRDADIAGNTLFIGGFFSKVNGQPRGSVAAIDVTTGELLPFQASVPGFVLGLDAIDGIVYLAGSFSSVNGQPRASIAAVDGITGATLPWASQQQSTNVYLSLSADKARVYVGGDFGRKDGANAVYGGAFSRTTGEITEWNPKSYTPIGRLQAVDGMVLISGDVRTEGDQFQSGVFVNNTTGERVPWLQSLSKVESVFQDDFILYLGGDFTSVLGVPRKRLASIDLRTQAVTQWNPKANGPVLGLARVATTVYVGGDFTSIGGGEPRNHLAAIDLTTGEVTDWNPSANATVRSLIIRNNQVYAGGDFSNINGQPRIALAAVDINTGKATAFNANIESGVVNAIAADGNWIYFGGKFAKVGGQNRASLAAVDGTTGALIDGWRSSIVAEDGATPVVNALVAYAGNLYIGGLFAEHLGEKNSNLVGISLSTTPNRVGWGAKTNGVVNSLAVMDNNIIAGGDFTTINNISRRGLAAVDASTAAVQSWDPHLSFYTGNPSVQTVSTYYRTVYIGGRFHMIGSQVRNLAGAIHYEPAQATPWHPDPSGHSSAHVSTINANEKYIIVGGNFSNIDYKEVQYLGVFTHNPFAEITAARKNPGAFVPETTPSNGKLYPNPARSFIQLILDSDVSGRVQYTISTASGLMVRKGVASVQKGSNRIDFDLSRLTPGNYILVIDKGNTIEQVKFVKL